MAPTRSLFGVSLLLLGLACSSSGAELRVEFASLISMVQRSQTPTMAFFAGVSRLPDGELSGEDMRGALRLARLPGSGMLHAFLGNLTGLRKDGASVTFVRSEAVTLALPGAAMRLDPTVKFRLRVGPDGIELDQLDGMHVGEVRDSVHPLRRVTYYRKDGRTWADLTAGYLTFRVNRTVDVTALTASAATSLGRSRGSAAPGMAEAVAVAPGGR